MSVIILTILFAAIMIGIGIFIIRHQKKPFLVFHPESIPALSRVMRIFGIIFLIFGGLCLITLFLNNDVVLFWMLIIACFIVIIFQIAMAQFFGKK